jgi:hypothetical protein
MWAVRNACFFSVIYVERSARSGWRQPHKMRTIDVQLILRQVVITACAARLGDWAILQTVLQTAKLPHGLRNDKSLCLFGVWWAHKDSNLGPAD